METLAIKAKTRSHTRCKELNNTEREQVEFLIKCKNLAQSVIPGSIEVDTNMLLDKSYQLFESMVSTLQTQMQNTREEQKEETTRPLM